MAFSLVAFLGGITHTLHEFIYIYIYVFFLFMHVASFSVFKLFFDINFHGDRNSHLYEINIGELLGIF